MQAFANPRATFPVLRLRSGCLERGIDIAGCQMPGDVGQPCAEGEGVDLGPTRAFFVGHGVQEMQHHAGILAHGAGDIAQHNKVRPTLARLGPRDPPDLSTSPHGIAQRAPEIHAAAQQRRLTAAGLDGLNGQFQPGEHPFGFGHFRRRHLLKVQRAQLFLGTHCHGRVDLDLRPAVLLFALRHIGDQIIKQGLRRALFPRLRNLFLLHTPDRGHHERHHVFEILRIAPVEPKDLRKDHAMFGSVHKTRMQRPKKIDPFSEPCRLDRADCINHAARADRQTGAAQGTGEVDDVLRKARGIGYFERKVFRHYMPDWRRCLQTSEVFPARGNIKPALRWLWPRPEDVWPLSLAVSGCRPGI